MVTCACLSSYRFRMQDLDSNCLGNWCPKVNGPCTHMNPAIAVPERLYAAVYCVDDESGEHCGKELMMPNDQSGVCEHLVREYRE